MSIKVKLPIEEAQVLVVGSRRVTTEVDPGYPLCTIEHHKTFNPPRDETELTINPVFMPYFAVDEIVVVKETWRVSLWNVLQVSKMDAMAFADRESGRGDCCVLVSDNIQPNLVEAQRDRLRYTITRVMQLMKDVPNNLEIIAMCDKYNLLEKK